MNVYLDYAATSPLDHDILEKILPYFESEFGNPDSPHGYGRRAAYAVSEARDRVARALGVNAGEVYFTSGGTEADNWAVRRIESGGVCVSAIEHRAVLDAAKLRAPYTVAPADEHGLVQPAALASALTADTRLACVMAVNNETGVLQPIEQLSALCKERGVLFFSDCVQAALTQDMKEIAMHCDALSLSGHKLYGPKGVGALVVKKGARLSPLIAGGEQEHGLRGGTLNVAAIVGFSYALEKAQREREAFCKHTLKLRNLFEEYVLGALKGEAIIDGENRVPNVSHLTFAKGGTAILHKLDLNGVAASGGAACSAQSALPSHVMLAMGRNEETALKGIRFSFGKHTTEEEVLFAARTLCGLL